MIRYAFFIFIASALNYPSYAATAKKSLTDINCSNELVKFCADKPPERIWECLLQNSEHPEFSNSCKKHLVDFPKLMSSKEQKFVAACKKHLSHCPNVEGDANENKRARRNCIFGQFESVSNKCKSATKEYISLLPADWRPKGWRD